MSKEALEQTTFIYDRLYGRIDFTGQDSSLFQTKELVRLHHLSVSAIPPWVLPAGICATKFEHSVGVGHLARIVGAQPEFSEVAKDLYFAALAHDLGTPPFSHASEYFQRQLLGKNHEAFLEDVISGSEFAQEVGRQGGSIDRVIRLVKGEAKPLSDLLNGTIDIDNLDNSLRYGLSMGILGNLLYSPERLTRGFIWRNDELALKVEKVEDLDGWENCRSIVYAFVYSPANLSPGMMLYRALDFAARERELKREFFLMTDVEAFSYLERNCNPRTKTLIERVKRWHFYPRVFNLEIVLPSDSAYEVKELFDNSNNRSILSDALSHELKIPPEDVSVYTGRSRGFKKIHIPIIDVRGDVSEHAPKSELKRMVQVYVHPSLVDRTPEVEAFMQDQLKQRNLLNE